MHKGRSVSAVIPGPSWVDDERGLCSGWQATSCPFCLAVSCEHALADGSGAGAGEEQATLLCFDILLTFVYQSECIASLTSKLIKENISSPRATGNSEKSNWVNRVEECFLRNNIT